MDVRPPTRPTIFDVALADAVCAAVARGESLLQACDPPGMPTRDSVRAWARADPEFARRLDAARLAACETFADDILAIADGFGLSEEEKPKTPAERLQRDRMRIAVRQWLMAKRDPETYGRGAAKPLQLDAEDDPAAREAPAWDWAEVEGQAAAFKLHDELVSEAKAARVFSGAPLKIGSALIGGRPIPLRPFISEDGRALNLDVLARHQEARIKAVRAHRARPGVSDDIQPQAEVLRAAEGFLAKRYGERRSLDPHRRSFERKFIQVYADIAHAWPDTAPPPI